MGDTPLLLLPCSPNVCLLIGGESGRSENFLLEIRRRSDLELQFRLSREGVLLFMEPDALLSEFLIFPLALFILRRRSLMKKDSMIGCNTGLLRYEIHPNMYTFAGKDVAPIANAMIIIVRVGVQLTMCAINKAPNTLTSCRCLCL